MNFLIQLMPAISRPQWFSACYLNRSGAIFKWQIKPDLKVGAMEKATLNLCLVTRRHTHLVGKFECKKGMLSENRNYMKLVPCGLNLQFALNHPEKPSKNRNLK